MSDENVKILENNGTFNVTCTKCGFKQEYQPRNIGIIYNNPCTSCTSCKKKFYINKEDLFIRTNLEQNRTFQNLGLVMK